MNEKEIEKRVSEILGRLTVDEKIGQLVQLSLSEKSVDRLVALAKEGRLGSAILTATAFAGNSTGTDIDRDAMLAVQTAACESRSGIPVVFGKDVIHGYRTIFPIPLAQAATFDADLVEEAASRMTREAAHSGIQWTFAPMLDLARDPRWGRIIESFGEDPYLGALFGAASVRGIQGDDMSREDKMIACAKHFVGYGAAEGGRDYNKSEITDYSLRNSYFPAFKAATEAGIGTFMNNFADIGGEPCVFSKYLFRDVIRGEWGFDGFVVSDWGSIANQIGKGSCENLDEAAERALTAGIDMDMCSSTYLDRMKALVEDGTIPMKLLDEAAGNVIRVKLRAGLFERPKAFLGELDIYHQDDMDFSFKMAKECMVLLKNSDNTLPLSKEIKIHVAGPFSKEKRSILGNWCPGATDEMVVPFVDAMREVFGKSHITFEELYDTGYAAARRADAIVLALGESWLVTGEANSLADISLSAPQVELVRAMHKLGKKVVLVVFGGRPLALSEVLPYADAILYAWHPGTCGTQAAAAILAGDASPAGRLPVSFLRSGGQIPTYYNHPKAQYHFREYCDEAPTPLFPFGYGLTYTTFAYGSPTVDAESLSLADIEDGKGFTVSATVKNTGNREGTEVVQLYIRDVAARKTRPNIELKGFTKITLAPGEERTVSFTVGKNALGYYPEKEFVVEAGAFDIGIGRDSEHYETLSVKVTK